MLIYLDLSDMDLSQVMNWMTIVSNLPSLCVLRMDSCQLLPMEFPSSISYLNSSAALHTISLSYNYFSDSSIFEWLSNLARISTQLEYLDLSWNAFEIPIPSDFANFHTLSYLSHSNNEFQGSVHKTISKFCNLRQLYLDNNHFIDELADVIQSIVNCENKALLTLDLSHNNFSGTIPDSINSFSSLKELHLNDNKLKGEISQGIGELTMLETLDLSSNYLEGTLTSTFFSNLSRLRELGLSDKSRVVIKIDENWIPPFQLDFIDLISCSLGPHFPKWLKLQTNVSYFDISNNGISDSIPFSFWSSLSSNCYYLNMSYNQFYGVLSNPLDRFPRLTIMDLSSNLFESAVPSVYAGITYLYL
ncbi:receptor-like protein 14 [Silene latifolia]|uniref:receptor-like protein 14 n=1 Tax=Silene latifolia TaxID=37657 RepID=UPI003D77A12F